MYSSELVRGTLKTVVLKILDEQPRMYGYQLSKEVKERTDNKIVLTEGALYPILHKLQKDNLVTSEEEMIGKRIRKYYRLTEKGKKVASEKTMELLDFMQTLALFIKGKPSISYASI
jgi:DNA-binding PadR family transcriptional regulator